MPTVRVAAAHGGSPGAAASGRALQRPAAGHCRVNLLQRPVLRLVHLQHAVGNVEYENVGISAANRLIGEVVHSRRRLLLGPSLG